jgi:acetyltransferase-like isoleucine patch superfamily enzyme
VTIEDDVFIGHGVMFSNNLFPVVDSGVGPSLTLVKSRSFIGNGALIGPGVTIGLGAFIGMGACVINNVPDLSIVVGNPARVTRVFRSLEERDSYIVTNRRKK